MMSNPIIDAFRQRLLNNGTDKHSRVVNLRQAAKLVGTSKSTVYRWTKKGLPSNEHGIRIGLLLQWLLDRGRYTEAINLFTKLEDLN